MFLVKQFHTIGPEKAILLLYSSVLGLGRRKLSAAVDSDSDSPVIHGRTPARVLSYKLTL